MVRRTNGFQKPYNPMQVGTWILLPALLLQFGFFATPILPLGAAIPCTIIILLCGMYAAYFAYKCCAVDPIDERLRCHLASEGDENYTTNQSSTHGVHAEQEADPTKFCWVCGIDVHEISMHCKFCDKCVSRFDHHCHWLNTCIGEANYEYFFRTVGCTLALVLVHGGVLAWFVISFFVQYTSQKKSGSEFENSSSLEKSNSWFGLNAGIAIASVNIVLLVVDLACISLLGQLFLFHMRLRRENITTYAYIVRDGQRKHVAAREKMQMGRKRIQAIGDAKKEGMLVRRFFLKAAGCPLVGEYICRPCDPLRLDEKKKAHTQNAPSEENKSDEKYERRNDQLESSFQPEEQNNTVELGECPPSSSKCGHKDEHNNASSEVKYENGAKLDTRKTDALQTAMEHRKESHVDETDKKGVEFITISPSNDAAVEAS